MDWLSNVHCLIYFALTFAQEMVTVNVDGSVLDRIAKIMSYLRLGSSGKVLKKKKKEKDAKGNTALSRLFGSFGYWLLSSRCMFISGHAIFFLTMLL